MIAKKNTILLFLVAIFCLCSLNVFAQTENPITLTDEQEHYPLGLHLEILEDKDGLWTIEDVTSPEISAQFVLSQDQTPSLGFTKSAYWVRFQARNHADNIDRWLLAIDSYLFFIDVYVPAADGEGYEVTQTGTARPYNARAVDHPRFLFDLPVVPGKAQTIHVRFESESAMNLSLNISSAEAIAKDDLVDQMLNGFLYGVLLIMMAYNFVLFLYLRDKSFLFYVLFLFALLMSNLIDDGIAHKYLWPNQGRINAIGGQFFFVLMLMFMLLFTNSFLRLKQYAPRLSKAIMVIVGAMCLTLLVQLIDLRLTAFVSLFFVISTFIIIITSGVLAWRKGFKPARYFLLAWVLLITSFVIYGLSLFGVVSLTLFSVAGTQIGIMVLALTLSIALADRISTYRDEKDRIQREILHQQEEFNESLQRTNKELAAQFKESTLDLGFAHEQLDSLFEQSTLAIGTAAMDGLVLTANDAMKDMLGYPDDEIFEVNVMDFFADEDFRNEFMAELIENKIARAPIARLKRKDGTLIYANITESILTRKDESVFLGIVDDITDQILAEQEQIKKAEETAVTEERERVARELHDSVTQTLYSASLIAEAVPKFWQQKPDEAAHDLEELRILTQGAQAEMRTLLLELRPNELTDRKLGELLRQLIDAMSARTELPISLTIAGDCEMPPDVQIVCYRVTQEALNNIHKHAKADRAWVVLNCEESGIMLRIGDNGRGFDPHTRKINHMGLQIMQERANSINAKLTINTHLDQGTEVTINWQPTEEKE